MGDLTALFLTLNRLPVEWTKYHREIAENALGDTPVISISKEPLDWGTNYLQEELDTDLERNLNLYRQILRGAELAETDYIAIIEDDTLYPKGHFEERPKSKGITFNVNVWNIYTWTRPSFYSYKRSKLNSCMIAGRELLIKYLKARFELSPPLPVYAYMEIGLAEEEHPKTMQYFYSGYPVLCFKHPYSSMEDVQRRKRKRAHQVRAFDIPYWGRAEDIVQKFR